MPIRFLYTFAVAVVFIIVVAIVTYFMLYIIGAVQVAGRQMALTFGSVDATYVSIDNFFTLMFLAFIPIALITLGLWIWHYTQLRGRLLGTE